MDDLDALLGDARARLRDVGKVRIGSPRAPGRIRRALGARPVIAPIAEAWHLGVLLIGDDAVWATGSVLRAAEEARRGYTAESQRRRDETRAMAFRGGFGEGETFHYDVEPIDAEHPGPLVRQGERIMVRWSHAGFLAPLDAYLDERIALARD